MAFARFVKKFVSPVAIMVTALMATVGVVPAHADAPAVTNYALQSSSTTWTPNSGTPSVVNLTGAEFNLWRASYRQVATDTSLEGKTYTVTGSVAGSGSNFSASIAADLYFYDTNGFQLAYGNIYQNGPGQGTSTAPVGTKRVDVSVRIQLMSQDGMSYYSGTGSFTPSFQIKLNGTAATLDNNYVSGVYSGNAAQLHLSDVATFQQATKSLTVSGNAGYTDITSRITTCVDPSAFSSGTNLNVKAYVDGTDVTSNLSSYAFYYESINSQLTSGSSGSTLTITQNMQSAQELYKVRVTGSLITNPSTVANHTLAVKVFNGANEVQTSCAPASGVASTTPTVTYDASNMNGPAGIYIGVSDPLFTNAAWTWTLYKASDNSVLGRSSMTQHGTMWPASTTNCGMNGCVPLAPAGVPVYAKVRIVQTLDNYMGLQLLASSPDSLPSGTAQIPNPYIVPDAPTNGSAPGAAKLVSTDIDYAAADQGDPSMMPPGSSFRTYSDGKNGVLKIKDVYTQNQDMSSDESARLVRVGASGVDSTFAGGGATGISLYSIHQPAWDPNNPPASSSYINGGFVGWYGNRDKWAASVRVITRTNQASSTSYVLVSGNFANNTVSTPVTLTESALKTACGTGYDFGFISPLSAPTSLPLYSMNCGKTMTFGNSSLSASGSRIVKVSANGTITELVRLSVGDTTTDTGFSTLAQVSNLSASQPSDVAVTIVGVSYLNTSMSSANIVERKGFKIAVDGSVTPVQNPFSSTATTLATEAKYSFSRTAPGLVTTGIKTVTTTVGQNTTTSYQFATLNANGTITDGDPITLESVVGFTPSSITFVDGQSVGTTGKFQMLIKQQTSKMAAATVDLEAKTIDIGEVVSYANSTDARIIQLWFVDEQGRLNWMYTSAQGKLSLIRWNGVSGGGSLPNGVTVTSVSTKFITNAATVVTILGTRLNTYSGGKLTIGTSLVTPSVSTATKLVVTVPQGTTAGDININGTFSGADGTLATVTRVGASKQDQTITDVADVTRNWAGSSVTASFPAASSVGLATSITASPAALCSVSGTTVSVNGSGVCTVTVVQAGDAGTNVAAAQTTTITVAPRTQDISALLTALGAANRTWNGNTATITLPAATSSVGLPVTIAVTPAAVCTNVANVITVKAAGACSVSLTTSKDNGTPALAKATATVTIAKGDLALTAAADFNVSDSAADSNNVVNVNADVAAGAESIVDYTYTSSNEDVCTVDDDGNVTGVLAGSCVITIAANAGPNWTTATDTVNVTVQSSTAVPADVLPEVADGNAAPKAIANNKNAFVATNDKSFLVKWDKAAGLLTYQATGVYIGWIRAETTFTVAGTSYTCVNVFGTTTAMKGATPAQRKLALKGKVFNATGPVCKDASKLSVPGSIGSPADFAKIAKAAKTTAEKTAEATALTKLKNFAGNVTIKITRYRAWPTTMKNQTSAGKKIPATVRTTVVALQ